MLSPSKHFDVHFTNDLLSLVTVKSPQRSNILDSLPSPVTRSSRPSVFQNHRRDNKVDDLCNIKNRFVRRRKGYHENHENPIVIVPNELVRIVLDKSLCGWTCWLRTVHLHQYVEEAECGGCGGCVAFIEYIERVQYVEARRNA